MKMHQQSSRGVDTPAWVRQRRQLATFNSLMGEPSGGSSAEAGSAEVMAMCQKLLDDDARRAARRDITPALIEQMFVRGMHAYQDGDYHAALPEFAQVVLHRPLNPRHYLALASTLQQLGLYRDALNFFSYALMLRANDPAPMFRMGECLLMLNEVQSAREMLETCLVFCEPDGPYAYLAVHASHLLASLH
jgi:tetratricopeptide (TPR) repeat protein